LNKLIPLLAFSILLLVPVGAQNVYSQVIIFQDDYSSNAGWTQVGIGVTVDSGAFPGIVKFDNANGGGGVNEKRVFKQLPSALPAEQWKVEFDYKFTASNIPAHFPLVLTATSDDLTFQVDSDRVLVKHGWDGMNRLQLGPSGAILPGAIPISANTQYYVTLERTPTQLILSAFSDPARTIHIANSPFLQTIAVTDFTNINYIQHSIGLVAGPARSLTAELDNTVIFDLESTLLVGGEIIPIEQTSLLLAGTQSFSWMIPVLLSGIGIGLFVFRKSENS